MIAALALGSACSRSDLSDDEKHAVAALSIDAYPSIPDEPSNRFADDRGAAALGASIFFDPRFSGDGTIACSSCHLVDRQFQDDLPLGRGVGTTDRRTMPLAGVAWSPWQFWDGRKDSLWSQALGPLEDAREHGGTRAAYAHVVGEYYRERYERTFGALPDLAGIPERAGPLGTADERKAWDGLDARTQETINTIFANIGKSLSAFERSIRHEETRFDRFARALAKGEEPGEGAALDETEMLGLRLFIGRANCVTCHEGPRFTDDHFHNTGVPQAEGLPEDLGRYAAVETALEDPFNCLGRYSDAPADACGELRFVAKDNHEMIRAFKTPSLRGAASRPPYMHSGQIGTLEAVIDHYAAAPTAPNGVSELVPLTLSERERKALVAFLRTLEPVPSDP